MQPLASPVAVEPHRGRRGPWLVAGAFFLLAVMTGTLSLLAFAYAKQSSRVEELQAQNQDILGQHVAIGAVFAEQSKKLRLQSRKLEGALRSSYVNGFRAGEEAARLPRPLRPLAQFAAAEILIPRRIPPQLSKTPRLETHLDGYALQWRGVGLFASTSDRLEVWTRQAVGGVVRTVQLGSHRVKRFVGPSGVIFAWRERGCTYGAISLPEREAATREVVRTMR
jgi:hypothetical protein